MMASDISRLRAREHQAFGVLVEHHYAPVQRYLARLTGHSEAAADLTQETFLRAYQALPRLADDSDLRAWLFRIATNLARQQHRHRQVLCWSRLQTHHAPSRSMEDDVARQDQVRRALTQLPVDQRACLLLYAWTGYTCAEIGHIVGKSTDAVRMLLVRARRRFRAAYGQGPDWTEGLDRTEREHRTGSDLEGLAGAGGGAAPRAGTSSAGAGEALKMEDERELPADCAAVDEALPFYPRGDLPLDTLSAVTRHRLDCPRCQRALADVQATYRLLRRYVDAAAIEDAPQAPALIMARVQTLTAPLAAPLAVPLPEPSAAGTTDEFAEIPAPVPVLVPARRRPPELPWPPVTYGWPARSDMPRGRHPGR